ncbi:MAG: hypothetical protein AB1657_05335 [Candidatus Micrarchaeota archaeon]
MHDDLFGGFSLRRDQNGWRPIFFLGNEHGNCPFNCRFCIVGKSAGVSSKENIRKFDKQYASYLKAINRPYHPVVYNKGNVTNPEEFSRTTLDYLLAVFSSDERTAFVSLNSREKAATSEVLDYLNEKNLPYPIHFIVGIESFSKKTPAILGKNTAGELDRFIEKLKHYNRASPSRKYTFGLDVNLLFLPQLYLDDADETKGSYAKIKAGIVYDVREVLRRSNPSVPIEINLHPFYRVETLSFQDADLGAFMKILPSLQKEVEHHNAEHRTTTHLFLGVEGSGYENEQQARQAQIWKPFIDEFNSTGRISWPY